MIRTVHLYGRLKREFGDKFEFAAENPAECIRALCLIVPGFQGFLSSGQYRFIRGDKQTGISMGLPLLNFGLGKEQDLHLIPAGGTVAKGGMGKVLLGAVLIGAAFIPGAQAFVALNVISPLGIAGGTAAFAAAATTIGLATKIGIAMVLGGISTMLTPKVKMSSPAAKTDSFLFGGATNSAAQGGAVPVIYGLVMAGSVVVSSGINVEQLLSGSGSSVSTPGIGNKSRQELYQDVLFSKGGKGAGASSSGQEDPNTLQSNATARVLDLISEGPIGGLASVFETGDATQALKSVYFDDVAVQNSDGTYNFKGMLVEQRLGNPSDDPMGGFSDAENEVGVVAQVKYSTPIIRSISDTETDSVRLIVTTPSLYVINAEKGSMKASTLSLKIDVKPNGGTYQNVITDTISGKTTTNYQKAYRFNLPGQGPWLVQVTRVTPDSNDSKLANDLAFTSYTAIIESKLTYPNSAMIGVTVDAQQFGSNVPNRAYKVYGRILKVPANYNAMTRTYATSGPGTTNGVWNGTFKDSWTNNPAWIMYDLITHERYGLGNGVSANYPNKWALYEIAQYCDGLVPDGSGGMEPRYTINTQIVDRGEAWDLLMSIVSVFRGMLYWGSNTVEFSYDHDETPQKLVTKANTIDGKINYSSDTYKGRHSAAIVSWNDPMMFYRTNYEVVEDPQLIEKYGHKPIETSAWGCTSRGQAHRVGKWILDTEKYGEMVTYSAGLDHSDVRPGTIIEVNDPEYTSSRMAGRILSAYVQNGVQLVALDSPVTLAAGQTYTVNMVLPDSTIEKRTVKNGAGSTSTLSLNSPFSQTPVSGSVWSMSSNLVTPRLFRVMSVEESGQLQYNITAVWHDPNKFARVEQGIDLPPNDFANIPTGQLAAPTDINLQEYLERGGNAATPSMLVSWIAAEDPRVTYYQYQLRHPGSDAWDTINSTTRLSDVVISPIPGLWAARVRSCDYLGHKSPWTIRETIPIYAGTEQVIDVAKPSIDRNPQAMNTTLRWNAVFDVRPVVYDILYNEVNNYDTAVLVATVDTTEYIVPRAGFYWVRPRFGEVVSGNPTVVEITDEDLPFDAEANTQYLTAIADGELRRIRDRALNYPGPDGASTYTLHVREESQRAENDTAFREVFDLLVAATPDGKALILRDDTVLVNSEVAGATSLTTLSAKFKSQDANIEEVKQVFVDEDGAYARALMRVTVDGLLAGYAVTNDGRRGSFAISANEFRVTNPDTGQDYIYADDSGRLIAHDVEVDTLTIGSVGFDKLQFAAVQKSAFQTISQGISVSRGSTVQIAAVSFYKEDNDSILKIQMFAQVQSPDDLQFIGSILVDDMVMSYSEVNIILDTQNSQGRMPITPFAFVTGIAAGPHSVSFKLYNTETDNINLTVAAGSTLEVTELRKGSIGNASGGGGSVG